MLARVLGQVLLAAAHAALLLWELLQLCGARWRGRGRGREEAARECEAVARGTRQAEEEEGERRARHAVLVVERARVGLEDLARLALWSLPAGLPYLTFYDVDGTLKQDEEKLFAEVEKLKHGIPGRIKWANRPDLNGYSNGHKPFTCTINIVAKNDGKHKIADFTKDLIQHKITCSRKSEQYTAEEIDSALKMYYPSIPDPDIVMFCGPVCMTKGLLPWQIRLSVFIPLSKYKGVKVEDFVNVLRKYSKCNQRFGK